MNSVALIALALLVGAGDKDDKPPTVKEIMQKLHGPQGLRVKLSRDMRGDTPNWQEVQKDTKAMVKFAEVLGKSQPPRGEKPSWDKLAEQYISGVKALDTAADKQDTAALKTAFARSGGSCTKCHNAHKPPMDD
jgi:cytochrome c556